jgi:hypothetical protein
VAAVRFVSTVFALVGAGRVGRHAQSLSSGGNVLTANSSRPVPIGPLHGRSFIAKTGFDCLPRIIAARSFIFIAAAGPSLDNDRMSHLHPLRDAAFWSAPGF